MLAEQLRAVGVEAGDCILVHTKLSALGFVPGAQRGVVEGLRRCVGPDGTIVMPAFSGELSDPAEWRYPPVPAEWIEPIRAETPAYDAVLTPSRKVGSVPEYFRTLPGTMRSPHPQSSFSAQGPLAPTIVGEHPLSYRFGPDGPLGKLYALGGKSVLLGAPLDTNSALYLTQDRMPRQAPVAKKAPVVVDGAAVWQDYRDHTYTCDWFADLAQHLLDSGVGHRGTVGAATCHVFPIRQAIDAGIPWRMARGRF